MNIKTKMSKSKCWFTYFDVFGIEYNFTIKGQDKHQTNTGATLTIIYCLIVIALFFGFGMDLYQRKNPRVSLDSEVQPYKRMNTSNDNFTFAYRIDDINGELLTDESITYTKVYYAHYENTNGVWNQNFLKVLPRKKCHELPNYEEKEAYFNISLEFWYCIDFDEMTWGGNWDGNFLYYFQLNIEQCVNSTENNNSCASKEKIMSKFVNDRGGGNLFYSDLALYSQPSMNNYETPLGTYLVTSYQMLNLQLTKRKIQTYKVTSVNNNKGWIFDNIEQLFIFNTDNFLPDFTFKDQWKDNVLYSSFHYLGNKVDTYNRNYTKIQEVIASVGGFAKFFYTMLVLLFYFISKGYKNIILINTVQFNEEAFLVDAGRKTMNLNENKFNNSKKNNDSSVNNNFMKRKEESITNIKKIEIRKDNKNNINYCNYCCHFMCGKKYKNTKLSNSLKRYDYYKKYFSQKMDVTNYLKLQSEFRIIKKVLLNKDQRKVIKLIKPKLEKKLIDEKTSKVLEFDLRNTNSVAGGETMKNLINMLEIDSKEIFKRNENNFFTVVNNPNQP